MMRVQVARSHVRSRRECRRRVVLQLLKQSWRVAARKACSWVEEQTMRWEDMRSRLMRAEEAMRRAQQIRENLRADRVGMLTEDALARLGQAAIVSAKRRAYRFKRATKSKQQKIAKQKQQSQRSGAQLEEEPIPILQQPQDQSTSSAAIDAGAVIDPVVVQRTARLMKELDAQARGVERRKSIASIVWRGEYASDWETHFDESKEEAKLEQVQSVPLDRVQVFFTYAKDLTKFGTIAKQGDSENDDSKSKASSKIPPTAPGKTPCDVYGKLVWCENADSTQVTDGDGPSASVVGSDKKVSGTASNAAFERELGKTLVVAGTANPVFPFTENWRLTLPGGNALHHLSLRFELWDQNGWGPGKDALLGAVTVSAQSLLTQGSQVKELPLQRMPNLSASQNSRVQGIFGFKAQSISMNQIIVFPRPKEQKNGLHLPTQRPIVARRFSVAQIPPKHFIQTIQQQTTTRRKRFARGKK